MGNFSEPFSAVILGFFLAGLNFYAGLKIKKLSLGKPLDQFFRLGVGWNAVRGALFLSLIIAFLYFAAPAQRLVFLGALGIPYFVFLSYEIMVLARVRL